jgi:bifunctional non-homologous end joining protein LigD
MRAELKHILSKDKVDQPAIKGAPRMRDATWVEPRLVAQVQFTEMTADGKLRHPSFQGLREDKSPTETQLEEPAAPPKTKRGAASAAHATAERTPALVTLSSPDKVLYPKDGYTKRDLADYYAAVTTPMLRALARRPLALQHWPEGIAKANFFRQSIPKNDRAPWMHIVDTPTSTARGSADHLVADRPETLQWLAQRSTLTVHMWASREGSLDQPDWVVFDLDPAEGHGVEQAVPVAQALQRLFEQLSMPSVVKTTGSRGLHVLVPLLPGHTHDDAIEFALKIGTAVTSVLKEATLERSIGKRHGRLYLDCLQNGYGKTIVAPYSPRAVDGARVSTPLKWSEVNESLDPAAFTIATLPKRLAKVGDLFAGALENGVRLPRLR